MRLIRPHGGYGLGNELIPWAKAWILAQELGAHCLSPSWGTNPRGYGRLFRSPPWDGLFHRGITNSFPNVLFGEDQLHSIGHHDFRLAARIFSEQQGLRQRKHYVVNITGLWAAFSGLEYARHFLLSRLLNTRYTVKKLATISSWLSPRRLRVGVHIGRGDFAPPFSWDYAGAVNMAWPDQWYLSIMRQICAEFALTKLIFFFARMAVNLSWSLLRLVTMFVFPVSSPSPTSATFFLWLSAI